MSDATDATAAEASDSPDHPSPLVTLEDFAAVDFEAPIRDLKRVDAHSLRDAFAHAFGAARAEADEPAARVFALLESACGIILRPHDRAEPWAAMASGPNWSTALPVYYQGAQAETFAALSATIAHPALRARLADLAWTNHRKLGEAGRRAATAYATCVRGLLSGEFLPWYDKAELMLSEAGLHLHRMLQIVHATFRKDARPEWAMEAVEAVYQRARADQHSVAFVRTADLALIYELKADVEVAAEAEQLATTVPAEAYPEATRKLWALAAGLHEKRGDAEGRRRCRIEAFEKTLAMRQFVLGSAGAEASWIMDALQELRHISGMEAREIELEAELRRLQKASLDEMASIPIDLEVEDDRKAVIRAFEDVDLPEGLKQFALLSQAPDPTALRLAALELRESTPLMAMMPVSHIDGEGRTAMNTPGAPSEGEPEDAWFTHMIQRSEGMRRARDVAGLIDPARVTLQARFGIEERHVAPVVLYTPFVPPSQKPLVILGFARFFQGDFMSAASLLLPQMEACLRHLLKLKGHDTAKRRDDATEEDRSISGLYQHFSAELETILGPTTADDINRVYNQRPGPALRHAFAHGQMSAQDCFQTEVYYGMWLMWRLCSLFLMKAWDRTVRPAVQEAT